MYARIVTVQTRPGQLDPASALFCELALPFAQAQPGFRQALLLTDADTGQAITITLWDSEQSQRASEADGRFMQQVSQVAPLLAQPPMMQGMQVRALV